MAKDLDQFIFITLQLKRFFMFQHPGEPSCEDRAATMLQFEALRFIDHQKKTTMGGLATALNISLSSATQLTERLVKSRLVKRTNDKKDRRIIRLEITMPGRKELRNFEKQMNIKLRKIFSKVPTKDLKELIRIHKNLLQSLEEDIKN